MAQQFNPQTAKKAVAANSTGRKRGPKTAPTLPVNNNWGGMTSLAQRIEWLKNNPAFDEVPATMEEFLGPRYLDIDPTQNPGLQKGVGIRPGVKKALIDIFGKGVDPNSISLIKRGMFTGGIGVGKSTLASIALTYMVHWVSCLHDPQGYFGLLPGSRIAFMMMSTRASHAQEVLFGDIKARINSCEWFKKNCPHDEKLTKQLRFPKDIWIIPGTSQETSVEGYNVLCGIIDEGDSHKVTQEKDYAEEAWNCVDEKTQILSMRGWLFQDELQVGDEVLTLNHGTGKSEWNKVEEVKRWDVENHRMVSWEGNEFSAFTTGNHRWPVINENKRYNKIQRRWTVTDDLMYNDRVVTSAVNADVPVTQKYSDAFVELVAWIYTEGSVVGPGYRIYQKQNTVGHSRIRAALESEFGPEKLNWVQYDYPNDRDRSKFTIYQNASRSFYDVLEDKVPTYDFLRSLTQAQLELFLNVSLLADNCGETKLGQKNPKAAEAYAFAGILAGYTVSIRQGAQKKRGYRMTIARTLKKNSVPVKQLAGNSKAAFEISDKEYTGVIWCPRTENKSWFARREGSTYYTGNTIHGRIASRFTDPVIQDHRGLLLAIGQMKKANGFMAKKKHDLLTDGKPNQLVVEMTIWDSLGWDRFMKGNKRDSFFFDIVRKKQATPAQAYGAGKNIIEIPNAYFKDFDNDPIRALKDHAGIPPAVEDPFITLIDRVDDAQDKWAERFKDKYKYTVDSSCTMPQFHPDFEADSILKRAVHVDIAFAPGGDAMGMAMGHIPELVEIDGELKPRIVFDFLLRMKPSGGDALQLADFRKILYHLRDDLKFKIGVVTFDGFNSMDSIQILRKKHFNVGEMSVDRTKAPYEELREAIYERRIEFPKYMTYLTRADTDKVNIARLELSELQDTGRKVDHPPKGSKDIADAMAGVVYDLMSNVSFRRGSKRDMTEQRIAEDEMEYNSKVLGDSFSLSQDEFAELSDLLSAEPGNPRNPISTGRPGYGLPPIEKDPFGLAGLNMP
ncbi:TerL [Gordonia phage GordTnk2]|uniref:TerL n=1 Tax=Gordonia phage GordTnk2 TaxID=1622192 RepID=A0A0E3XBB0_9CAUD|nr:TerL [Gordonia phage GordTnk2]AKC02742.1 TerL [Gordonia phage GordTnk2]